MSLESKLQEFKLEEEQVSQLKDYVGKNYVSKEKFNELTEAKKSLESTVADRDKQLVDLKKEVGDNEGLRKTISDLQDQNKTAKAEYDKSLNDLKINNALETALTQARAKSNEAVKALLKMDKMELGDDGKIKGLTEALEKAQKDNAWAFDQEKNAANVSGFKPQGGGDNNGG